jgi:hypothetical protein
MAVKGFALTLSAACMLVQFHAQAAGQVSTQVPTEVPTQLKPQLNPQLATEQQPRPAAGTKVVIEGCVERAQRNGSVGGTGLGTTSSPNTADRDANSSEPLDVFQLNNAHRVPREASEGMDRTTYALEGRESDMGAHTGHRVQISGLLAAPKATGTPAAAAAGISRVRVEQVKMISATCDGDAVR